MTILQTLGLSMMYFVLTTRIEVTRMIDRCLQAAIFLSAILSFILPPRDALADSSPPVSLGLPGCTSTGVVTNSEDGQLVFALCRGPKGVFYSVDEGRTFRFAGRPGTAYQFGSATNVFIKNSSPRAAYLWMGFQLLKTDVPAAPIPSTWEPTWAAVTISSQIGVSGGGFSPQYQRGRFVIGTLSGSVAVLSLDNEAIVSASPVPGFVGSTYALVPTGNDQTIWVGYGIDQRPNATAGLVRAGFNTTTGIIDPAWIHVPLVSNGLSVAPGLQTVEAGTNVPGIYNISISAQNKIYVSVHLPSGVSSSQMTFTSIDQGASFQALEQPQLRSGAPLGSFVGLRELFGPVLSLDGGTSWSDLRQEVPSDWQNSRSISLLGYGSVLEPGSGRWAYLSTNVGYARVGNIGGMTEWVNPSGFDGLSAQALVKAFGRPSVGIVSTGAGLSVSTSINQQRPRWLDNYCPMGQCPSVGVAHKIASHSSLSGVFFVESWQAQRLYRLELGSDATPLPAAIKALRITSLIQGSAPVIDLLHTDSARLPGKMAILFHAAGLVPDGGEVGGIAYTSLSDEYCPLSDGADLAPSPACTISPVIESMVEQADGSFAKRKTAFKELVTVTPNIHFAIAKSWALTPPTPLQEALYRSDDGGSTFRRTTHPSLENLFVSSLTYDRRRDILYALGTPPPGITRDALLILMLTNASQGGSSWTITRSPLGSVGAPAGGSLLSVDPATGWLALAGSDAIGGGIWISRNRGTSFRLLTRTSPGETINFMSFDEGVQTATVEPKEPSGMVFGTSDGFYRAAIESQDDNPGSPTPVSTPTEEQTLCRLRQEERCRTRVNRGTMCTFQAQLLRGVDSKRTTAAIQYSPDAKTPYRTLNKVRRSAKGAYRLKLAIEKPGRYRAVFSKPRCITADVTVRLARRSRR